MMILLNFVFLAKADTPRDYVIGIEAQIIEETVQLNFDNLEGTATIKRREPNSLEKWQNIAVYDEIEDQNSWADTAVNSDENWEYMVSQGIGSNAAKGFITVAVHKESDDYKGIVALVIDNTIEAEITTELNQFKLDLIGDGWDVVSTSVGRTDSVVDVRNYLQNVEEIEAAILIGHVPVPYSGNINPDGHTDHKGAWPADTYYGDLDGVWTDDFVENNMASREDNHNSIGDGKFDQSEIPSEIDIQVGRIDMHSLFDFNESEVELLKRYFQKNHQWRMNQIEIETEVVIEDGFGMYAPEAITAWLLAPVVGIDSLYEDDFLATVTTSSPLFAYGSGAGSYTRASNIINTSHLSSEQINGVFLMLFGSYFGDWDSEDNLLRSAIASDGNVLASFWAGRPTHQLYWMGTGYSIGYAVRKSQNAKESVGVSGHGLQGVHTALLGDPTLHAFPSPATESLSAASIDEFGTVQLIWSEVDDASGYFIYNATSQFGPYTRVTSTPIENTETTVNSEQGEQWWMVRSVHNRTTPSGQFTTFGQGQFVSLLVECTNEECNENTVDDTSTEKRNGCTTMVTPEFAWLIPLLVVARRRDQR
jgi:hypothetical protein